jgi:hypothetical protein
MLRRHGSALPINWKWEKPFKEGRCGRWHP